LDQLRSNRKAADACQVNLARLPDPVRSNSIADEHIGQCAKCLQTLTNQVFIGDLQAELALYGDNPLCRVHRVQPQAAGKNRFVGVDFGNIR
jgi:hypothetical protein